MLVKQMQSNKGNFIANQFIINERDKTMFQSYDRIIAEKGIQGVKLDKNYWDYSRTTGKYRNIFLGETKKETEKKIKNGEYTLTNLN